MILPSSGRQAMLTTHRARPAEVGGCSQVPASARRCIRDAP
ncbi:hypothetical protein [Microbacterium sp. cx-55]|nr:hypothetical protein [Microbacterium sp. cx-55]